MLEGDIIKNFYNFTVDRRGFFYYYYWQALLIRTFVFHYSIGVFLSNKYFAAKIEIEVQSEYISLALENSRVLKLAHFVRGTTHKQKLESTCFTESLNRWSIF